MLRVVVHEKVGAVFYPPLGTLGILIPNSVPSKTSMHPSKNDA
jgi:hypothetical protein